MMRRVFGIGAIALSFFVTSVLAQDEATHKTKLEFVREGENITTTEAIKGALKVKADKVIHDDEAGTTTLTGNVLISALRPNGQYLHFKADQATIETEQMEVQISAGDVAVRTDVPLEKLVVALESYPEAPRFRVTWEAAVLSLRASATAVYDRRNNTLKYRAIGGYDGGVIDEYYLYTKVTDDILKKLEKSRKSYGSGSVDAGFQQLPNFGGKSRKLR